MRHVRGIDMKYFVLNPNKRDRHGEASRKAIRTYARFFEKENLELFIDLNAWMDKIEEEEKGDRE